MINYYLLLFGSFVTINLRKKISEQDWRSPGSAITNKQVPLLILLKKTSNMKPHCVVGYIQCCVAEKTYIMPIINR